MNINLLVIPTLIIALLLFIVGEKSIRHCPTPMVKAGISLLWLLIGIPGLVFPLYYLHWLDNAKWFYEFRSLPFTELTAASIGLLAGALAELIKNFKYISRPFLIVLLCLGILAPHLKPILVPVARHRFSNRWQDEVCLQSTPSSCGAASAATVFKLFGIDLTERAIAKECLTCASGTENWYIARAFKRRGLKVNYRIEDNIPSDLKTPAIAGVRVGGAGHFIVIMSQTDKVFSIGDPLTGRKDISKNKIAKAFEFTGFFMEIQQEN